MSPVYAVVDLVKVHFVCIISEAFGQFNASWILKHLIRFP